MFEVSFLDTVIGHSALEHGDPPMGGVEGSFFPSDGFADFLSDVRPGPGSEKDRQQWTGLTLSAPGGAKIECHEVVLVRYDFGDDVEFAVTVIGVRHPLYEKLFPEHVAKYRGQFPERL